MNPLIDLEEKEHVGTRSIRRHFSTQQICLDYLESLRWAEGLYCAYCQSNRITPMPKERRYKCGACNRSFSVITNTIFHKTKLELSIWFEAIIKILNAKKSISARELGRDLEICKETAWFLCMRIRKAMAENDAGLLYGICEMDEKYIVSRKRGNIGRKKANEVQKKEKQKRGRGVNGIKLLGVVSRDLSKVRIKVVADVTTATIKQFCDHNIKMTDLTSTLITDEFASYRPMREYIEHRSVNHSERFVDEDDATIHTNSIEGAWGLLTRGIIGAFHKYTLKYAQNYVDEFMFRYNYGTGQKIPFSLFKFTLDKALNTCRRPLASSLPDI